MHYKTIQIRSTVNHKDKHGNVNYCSFKIVLFLPKSCEVPSPRTNVKFDIKPCEVHSFIGDPLLPGMNSTSGLRRLK